MQTQGNLRRPGGFTIVEMLFVVVISAIIATIGIPSFIGLIKNNQMNTSVNDLVTAIQLAYIASTSLHSFLAFSRCSTASRTAPAPPGRSVTYIASARISLTASATAIG